MKILVACEESQVVTVEMRKRGHEAYSCDIEPCSGGHPEWHIHGDAKKLVNGNVKFKTMSGETKNVKGQWDLLIAHPPCTYLTTCCNRAYSLNCNSARKIVERYKLRDEAIKFFMVFINADCDKIAVENPQGCMNTLFRKPDMIIHPYYFAESIEDELNYHQKKTCFWLKGLPHLERTNNLPKPKPKYVSKGIKTKGKSVGWSEGMSGIKGGQKERAKARSKTFPAIAKEIAEQWT